MKPKTKLQKQIVALSDKLPRITKEQEVYAYKQCLNHEATRLKSGIVTCLDCGHKWKDAHRLLTSIDCTCPSCNTKLKVTDTRKQKFNDWAYYGIVTTFQGFQVFRYYKVHGIYKVGKPVYHNFYEVAQIWLAPDGKYECLGYIHQAGYNADTWTGNFELRGRGCVSSYDLHPYKIYPKKSIIPEVKRNGFKGQSYGHTLFSLFYRLLSNSKIETLLKTKQYALLQYSRSEIKDIEKYWPTIKICIRNNYIIKDASIWIDYLGFMEYFNKDIRNAKYACPDSLEVAHDYWMGRNQKAKERVDSEKRRIKALKDEKEFKKLKGKFFGIGFSDEVVEVKVLESVLEHLDEGAIMHHCVDSYALKDGSIILSARIDGKRIETVEVSLKTFEVTQSRGLQNKNTEFHDQIISLVNKNMHLIKERLKPKKDGTKKNVNRVSAACDIAV